MSKRSALTNKLDKLASILVRSKGKCVRCGNDQYEKLQCCHIYSRTYRSVRWYLDNLLCLCAGCHFWGHKNPLEFAEFVKNYLGELRYEQLKSVAISTKKWTIEELKQLKKAFQKVINEL